MSSAEAGEANQAYQDIAFSAAVEGTPQSLCSVAIGAALGVEADKKHVAQARSDVAKAAADAADTARTMQQINETMGRIRALGQ